MLEPVEGDAFVQARILDPLGMKDTTFYPTDAQRARLATAYTKNPETGAFAGSAQTCYRQSTIDDDDDSETETFSPSRSCRLLSP